MPERTPSPYRSGRPSAGVMLAGLAGWLGGTLIDGSGNAACGTAERRFPTMSVAAAASAPVRARPLPGHGSSTGPETSGEGAAVRLRDLVPSPAEEHARFLAGLGAQLAETLERIEGVVEARVHVALPADDGLSLLPRKPAPPKASVLLLCGRRPDGRVPVAEEDVRRLVSGAVEGLQPEAVTVVYAAARRTETRISEGREASAEKKPPALMRTLLLVGLSVAGTLAATVAVRSVRRRGAIVA